MKELLKIFAMISLGILAVTVPILLYFVVNNAFSDLWTVYFYYNLYHYGDAGNVSNLGNVINTLVNNCFAGIISIFCYNVMSALLIVAGGLALLNEKEKRSFALFIATLTTTAMLVYCGSRHFIYYSFIFCAFMPVGITAVYSLLSRACQRVALTELPDRITNSMTAKTSVCAIISVLCIFEMFIARNMTVGIFSDKSELTQYQFAEIINQTENATLLQYDWQDAGFYLASGILPDCKYFSLMNMNLSEYYNAQNEYVDNGLADYVVAKNTSSKDFKLYDLVSQSDEYCLYRLKSLSTG